MPAHSASACRSGAGGPSPASLPARTRRRRLRGQALVEFALVVPLMFGIVGVTLDFARIYQVWMRLQAVTRDTAEFLATDATYQTEIAAQPEAERRICTAVTGSSPCPASVRPLVVELVAASPGSAIWVATVRAEYDFQTFFLWPIVRGLTGVDHWTIRTEVTYEILRRAE